MNGVKFVLFLNIIFLSYFYYQFNRFVIMILAVLKEMSSILKSNNEQNKIVGDILKEVLFDGNEE